jgi:hypothetical protein
MRARVLALILILGGAASSSFAGSKPRVITFGKPITVKLAIGPTEDKTVDMKIRGLYVDGNLKEFVTGDTHDITDRVFVTRKAFRLNDNLPEDAKTPHWKWQRGSWLMVDRTNAHITAVKLPEFDPFYSNVSWYRDYAAYCGISDSGETLYAVVAQIGRKKAVLRKELGAASQGDTPESDCDAPQWERTPSKVTFFPKKFPKVSYTVFGHATDIATDNNDDDQ